MKYENGKITEATEHELYRAFVERGWCDVFSFREFVARCEVLGTKIIDETLEMEYTLDPGAFAPDRAHPTDAGLDLRCKEDTIIPAGGSAVFDTGVHLAIPHGYYAEVQSKSGLNVKHDVVSLGGTIDEPYRGGIVVKLYNLGKEDYVFKRGDKVAQLVIMPYLAPKLKLVDSLDETDRGSNGFGSSGR